MTLIKFHLRAKELRQKYNSLNRAWIETEMEQSGEKNRYKNFTSFRFCHYQYMKKLEMRKNKNIT